MCVLMNLNGCTIGDVWASVDYPLSLSLCRGSAPGDMILSINTPHYVYEATFLRQGQVELVLVRRR